MTAAIKPFVLRALRRMDGQPFPESSLVQTVQLAFPADNLSLDETKAVLGDMEAAGFLSAHKDELTNVRLWTLTAKGVARANQLH